MREKRVPRRVSNLSMAERHAMVLEYLRTDQTKSVIWENTQVKLLSTVNFCYGYKKSVIQTKHLIKNDVILLFIIARGQISRKY